MKVLLSLLLLTSAPAFARQLSAPINLLNTVDIKSEIREVNAANICYNLKQASLRAYDAQVKFHKAKPPRKLSLDTLYTKDNSVALSLFEDEDEDEDEASRHKSNAWDLANKTLKKIPTMQKTHKFYEILEEILSDDPEDKLKKIIELFNNVTRKGFVTAADGKIVYTNNFYVFLASFVDDRFFQQQLNYTFSTLIYRRTGTEFELMIKRTIPYLVRATHCLYKDLPFENPINKYVRIQSEGSSNTKPYKTALGISISLIEKIRAAIANSPNKSSRLISQLHYHKWLIMSFLKTVDQPADFNKSYIYGQSNTIKDIVKDVFSTDKIMKEYFNLVN